MNIARRIILALALIAGITPAIAQVPPPVPGLPDTERRTTYSLTASTCACNVNFALYGDSTDYQDWLEVWINGVMAPYNDPAMGWAITSPSGPLANLARPITNAVLTFTNAQTGTIQIVGARRPRRTSQFNEGVGVSTRNFNVVLSDIVAMLREVWDKINDVTGRVVRAPPGETLNTLPPASGRASMNACFDSGGNLTSCVGSSSGSFAAGNGIAFNGTNPTTISNNIQAGTNISLTGTNPVTISTNFNVVTLLNAACSLSPSSCTAFFGYSNVSWYGAKCDGTTDDNVALNLAMSSVPAGGTLYFPVGVCMTSATITRTLPITMIGSGMDASGIRALSGLSATSPLFEIAVPNNVTQTGYHFSRMFFFNGFGSAAVEILTAFSTSNIGSTVFDAVDAQGFSANAHNYGLWLNNSGGGSNGGIFNLTFRNGLIEGGIQLTSAGDSLRFQNNIITGGGTGLAGTQIAGAGGILFEGNNTSSAGGGVFLDCAVAPRIIHNIFEAQTTVSNGAMVYLAAAACTITNATVTENQIQVGGGFGNPFAVIVAANNVAAKIDSNFIVTQTTAISNSGGNTLCGNNSFNLSAPHFTGTTPTEWGNGC